jgi:hypothetical protein
MPDPRAVQIRQKAAEDRKAARDTNADVRDFVVLGQIADALFSLRDEVQDIRIALEMKK